MSIETGGRWSVKSQVTFDWNPNHNFIRGNIRHGSHPALIQATLNAILYVSNVLKPVLVA